MQISIGAMQSAVSGILEDYQEEVIEAVDEAAEEVAKEAKKELKATSPKGDGKKKGHYADGWSYRVEKSRVKGTQVIVSNAKKPGLTHLLENGHVTRNGTGRRYPNTPAHPHIAAVNDKAQMDFIDKIESKLGF